MCFNKLRRFSSLIVKGRRVKTLEGQGEKKGEDEEWYLLGDWNGLITDSVQHYVNCKYPKQAILKVKHSLKANLSLLWTYCAQKKKKQFIKFCKFAGGLHVFEKVTDVSEEIRMSGNDSQTE